MRQDMKSGSRLLRSSSQWRVSDADVSFLNSFGVFVARGFAGDFVNRDVFENDVFHGETGVAEDAEGGVGFIDDDVAEMDAVDRRETFLVGGDEVAPLVEDVGLDAEDADAGLRAVMFST